MCAPFFTICLRQLKINQGANIARVDQQARQSCIDIYNYLKFMIIPIKKKKNQQNQLTMSVFFTASHNKIVRRPIAIINVI